MGFGKPNKKILVMIIEYLYMGMPYFIIGFVFTIIYDWLLSKLEDTELHFTNIERILMVIIWPIFLTITIINVIKFLRRK